MRLESLRDHVVVITGASMGLGAAAAREFAASGARVVLASRREQACREVAESILAAGGDAFAHTVDVRDEASVQALIQATLDRYGRIDALINNAAVRDTAPALEISREDWDDILAANLTGAFLCARAAARAMIPRGYGRIVNVTSMLAVLARPGRAAYGASKAGLGHLTRMLALEWMEHGIRVNAVAPTTIETEVTESLRRRDPALADRLVAAHPIGRAAVPSDITGMLLYLASPEADFITGQTIYIDGGRSLA